MLRELPRAWKTTHRREYLQGDGVETWLEFEYRTWALGEGLRQVLPLKKNWKQSSELWDVVAKIAEDRELRHGSQPYFELLARYGGTKHHQVLLSGLDNECVQGHAVKALRIAGVVGAEERVAKIQSSARHAWVRREAKKYLAKVGA